MSEPFLSEIRMFSFAFAPKNWALCNGQTFAISQNQALFALLGTTFGGDGVRTFGLPDFRGRVPLHPGAGFGLGQTGGEQTHTLTNAEMPPVPHSHTLNAVNGPGTDSVPTSNLLATSGNQLYVKSTAPTAMNAAAISTTGGQPHNNMQPYLAVNFSIALAGIFPPRN